MQVVHRSFSRLLCGNKVKRRLVRELFHHRRRSLLGRGEPVDVQRARPASALTRSCAYQLALAFIVVAPVVFAVQSSRAPSALSFALSVNSAPWNSGLTPRCVKLFGGLPRSAIAYSSSSDACSGPCTISPG